VDYPNSNAGSNAAAHRAYMDQNLQAPSFTPPGAPNYPLADMETNLKREADYYTQKGRDTTRGCLQFTHSGSQTMMHPKRTVLR